MTEHQPNTFPPSGDSTPISPDASASQTTSQVAPHFPPSDRPRVWFLTAGDAPISVSVARQLLEHGDYVVAGLDPITIPGREGSRAELDQLADSYPWKSDGGDHSPPYGETAKQDEHMQHEDTDKTEPGQNEETQEMSPKSLQPKPKGKTACGQLILAAFEISSLSSIQSAYALALERFGRIDVLLVANNQTVIGSVEELGATARAQSLLREQFAANFFGPVNAMKAVLSVFRQSPPSESQAARRRSQSTRHIGASNDSMPSSATVAGAGPGGAQAASTPGMPQGGHIVLLTGITGHLGTPGLGAYCASQWAVEGYCDSIAYEVAPFNVRISILQSNIEVTVLTNPIAAVPAMAGAYGVGSGSFGHELDDTQDSPNDDDDDAMDGDERANKAPLARGWLGSLVGRLEAATASSETASGRKAGSESIISGTHATSIGCPPMPVHVRDALIAETVYAVLSIGGHENPPARHIVSHEGVMSVKEKLKTISEELEDFVSASLSVDLQ